MTDQTYKLPRIYINQDLKQNAPISLNDKQAHYLKNVMRKQDGDQLRVFNGQDGEWLGTLQNVKKKSAEALITDQLRPQPADSLKIHIYFAPITKNRMDWMIEKLVELGITDLHPIISQNTDVRKIKEERVNAQIIEAAEQCERLTRPTLHPLEDMMTALKKASAPIIGCIERFDAQPIQNEEALKNDIAFLIGPVGGFTEEEKTALAALETLNPVSLGENVLRVETAALYALSIIQAQRT